jgi:hypothetical protein
MIEKIMLSISYTVNARKSYSHTGCSMSANICVISIRTPVTQRNHQSKGYLEISTDQIPSYVNDIFLGHFHRRNLGRKIIDKNFTWLFSGNLRSTYIKCNTNCFLQIISNYYLWTNIIFDKQWYLPLRVSLNILHGNRL